VRAETAERVRRVMEELGYRPNTHAQSLVSGRSRLFGLVVSDITNPFFPEVVKVFQDLALQNGYDVLVASTNYDAGRMAQSVGRMIGRKVDGVAIMTSEIDRKLIDQLSSLDVPLVLLDVGKVGKGLSNVKVDYAHGITEAVDHLLSLGHRHIAFIAGPPDLTSARMRRATFLRCLSRHCISDGMVEEGNHKVDGGLSAIARLLARPDPPTAVLASNDLTAIGALSGIRQAGLRVPDDISVVGFDDIGMARFTEPPLTTVRLARDELARLACKALLDSMGGRQKGCELHMTTSLLIRQSTARVREAMASAAP
jgi:LacI family transcriptional regulator